QRMKFSRDREVTDDVGMPVTCDISEPLMLAILLAKISNIKCQQHEFKLMGV
ncbi:unnamed protein product, partial [Ceratitis capitata]